MIKYIAIEREYGSGGSLAARQLAQRCGMACYGREILERAGQILCVPVAQLERYEERTTNSFLYCVNMMSKAQTADPDMLMREGHLFVAEHQAIRDLAAQGPAVFIGHCASQVLAEYDGVLRVFIQADPARRKARAVEEYAIAPEEAEATLRRFDKKRGTYYGMNTAKKWRDPRNYDMILDSSTLGIDGCVAAMEALLRKEYRL